MNKILCFDVSSNSCSVSISEGQNILYFNQEMRPSIQAEKLMVMIEGALETTKKHYNDLDYLAVTLGPGSFTGIRIGLAAAKGILYASNLKPIGINNFDAAFYRLQTQVKEQKSAFVILNAYREQVYVQEFVDSNPKGTPLLMDNDEIIKLLKSRVEQTICTGSGMNVLYPELKNLNHLQVLPRFPAIKALHIARLADDKINNGEIPTIEPLYIRPPDAIAPKNII